MGEHNCIWCSATAGSKQGTFVETTASNATAAMAGGSEQPVARSSSNMACLGAGWLVGAATALGAAVQLMV